MAFTEFKKKMLRTARALPLKPGDIYEDCAFHPVLCLGVNYKTDELWGISLIDGSYPRGCSLVHCGVRKLTPKEAWLIKTRGPTDPADRERVSAERRWWNRATELQSTERVSRVGPAKMPRLTTRSSGPSRKRARR
jgi:hypothetical protein